MARSVPYSVSPRINPRDKEAAPKFYAQAQARGDVSIREMAERIQSTCTVTKADVYAVLVALEDVIVEALQNGEIVRLGEVGTFRLSIKRAKINFRPGLTLAGMLGKLQFSKVDIKYAKEDAADKEEGGEDLTD